MNLVISVFLYLVNEATKSLFEIVQLHQGGNKNPL